MWLDIILPVVSILLSIPGVCLSIITLIDRHTDRRQKSRRRIMGFIQKEVLSALEESGRDNWTSRQMTKLTSEGLLPKLIRTTQPGTNKPLYVWEETDLDQIVTIYDLLEYYGGSHEAVSLVLWLEGYGISLDLLRRTFLRPIENYLQRLTQRETDPDEIAFSVSSIALMLLNKLQFTPGLDAILII